MGSKDIEAVLNGVTAYIKQCDGFFHAYSIDLIALFQPPAAVYNLLQVYITCFLGRTYAKLSAFALGLALVQKAAIALCQLLQLLSLSIAVAQPCVLDFHNMILLVK